MEPTQIPIEGIIYAYALSRVMSGAPEPSQVTSQDGHTVTSASNDRAYCMNTNFSEEALIIPKVTVLGIAGQVPEPLVDNKRKEPRKFRSTNKATKKEQERSPLSQIITRKIRSSVARREI